MHHSSRSQHFTRKWAARSLYAQAPAASGSALIRESCLPTLRLWQAFLGKGSVDDTRCSDVARFSFRPFSCLWPPCKHVAASQDPIDSCVCAPPKHELCRACRSWRAITVPVRSPRPAAGRVPSAGGRPPRPASSAASPDPGCGLPALACPRSAWQSAPMPVHASVMKVRAPA